MARSSGPRVEIPGFKQFMADVKTMPKDVQKQFAKDMQAVAKVVADDAQSRVPSVTGTAAGGISKMGGRQAGVKESRLPAYLRWLDFGTRTPRTGNTRAEGPWRGSGAGPKGGRFVYPAIEDNQSDIQVAAVKAVDRAAEKAGFR